MAAGKAGKKKLLSCAILFIFWVALTATTARHELVVGLVCSAFVAALTASLLGRAIDPHITLAVLLRLPFFLLRLLWEILKANYDVAKIILDPRLPVDPVLITYRTFLPHDLPRTVFSDSITLTPGTVTVELDDDLLSVHCLCPYHEKGLARLEGLVGWLFGVSGDG